MGDPAAYAATAYDSQPHTQTNPGLLEGLVRLFGLTPARPTIARILEIGCATGTNLMAIAALYPQAECVGVDYSPEQIATAVAESEKLGLKNVRFITADLRALPPSLGRFDYIIAHGVFSWIPVEMQNALLRCCRDFLNDTGVGYVSYNTFPGWHILQGVRAVMMRATEHLATGPEKAAEARRVLGMMVKAQSGPDHSIYGELLQRELQTITDAPDFWLLHDHLEVDNNPLYFDEFVKKAQAHGLRYVTDALPATVSSSSLPPAVAPDLEAITDRVKREQMIDFITNRRFRCSIITHAHQGLQEPETAKLDDAWLMSRFTLPATILDYPLASRTMITLKSPANLTLQTNDPVLISMMQELAAQRSAAISFADLVSGMRMRIQAAFGPNAVNEADLKRATNETLIKLCFMSGVTVLFTPPDVAKQVSDRPRANKVATKQAASQPWIANQYLEAVNSNPIERKILSLCDGTRTLDDLLFEAGVDEIMLRKSLEHFIDKALLTA